MTRKINGEELLKETKFFNKLFLLDGNSLFLGITNKLGNGLVISVSCSDVIVEGYGRSRAIIISSDDIKQIVDRFGDLFATRMLAFVIAHETGHINYWNNFPVAHKGELVVDLNLEVDADQFAIEHTYQTKKAYQEYINVFNYLMRLYNKRNVSIPARWIFNCYNDKLGKKRMNQTLSIAQFEEKPTELTFHTDYHKLAKNLISEIVSKEE